MSMNPDFAEIRDNFEFLDDWEDRYKYLIELGGKLTPISDDQRTSANKVNGCVSQVWLCSTTKEQAGAPHLFYTGDSDAMIVKGLVAVLISFYNGQSAKWVHENDAITMFDSLGLREHLTAQRANGLTSMVERIHQEAQALI